jgi:hypothetical protein
MFTHARHPHRASRSHQILRRLQGNIDSAVLRRENQTATHVTPRIDAYAHGLFREQLCVVGPPPACPIGPTQAQMLEMRKRLLDLLAKASAGHQPNIELRNGNRLASRSVWMTEVVIDKEVFGVSLCLCSMFWSDILSSLVIVSLFQWDKTANNRLRNCRLIHESYTMTRSWRTSFGIHSPIPVS